MEISLLLSAAQSAPPTDIPRPGPPPYLSSSPVTVHDDASLSTARHYQQDPGYGHSRTPAFQASALMSPIAHMSAAPRLPYALPTAQGKIEKKAIKPFRCTIEGCDATFGQKGSLTRHIKSRHEKLRPHSCDVCQKSFSALWTLRVHQRNVHLKSKPHKCHLCDKSFGELFNKSKHIAIVHEGKRPFSCPICSRAFGYKGDMRKHVLELHEQSGRPFQCKVPSCGVKFARKRYLRRHENLSHKGSGGMSSRDLASSPETSPNVSYSSGISFLSGQRPSSFYLGRPSGVGLSPLSPPPPSQGFPSTTMKTSIGEITRQVAVDGVHRYQ